MARIPHDVLPPRIAPAQRPEFPVVPKEGVPWLVVFQPWTFPPENSVAVDVVDVQNVAAGATVTIPILSTGTGRGVLRFFGNESPAASGYVDLRWTIRLNQRPLAPYVSMRESRGLISDPDPIVIVLGKSIIVDVQVANLSGVAAWDAKTRLKGWVW